MKMMSFAIWPFFFLMLMVFALVFLFCRYFSKKVILPDHPNHRSSHFEPTSRAGGIAILLSWCSGVFLALALVSIISRYSCDVDAYYCLISFEPGFISFLFLIIGAALLGLLDDLFELKPIFKFSGQGVLALLFVLLVDHVAVAPVPFLENHALGIFGAPLTFFWIVGLMNAYNFMDGANGLAASVAVLVLMIIVLFAFINQLFTIVLCALLLVAALLAFLPFNMLKSGSFIKGLFMGDSGSQMVSFMIAGLAILLPVGTSYQIPALFVPVLMLPFIADVAFTLIHRLRRRQNILRAHREHVYQLLIRMGLNHNDVSVIYVGLTAICGAAGVLMLSMPNRYHWLVPLALLGGMWPMAIMTFKRAEFKGIIPGPVS